MIVDTRFSSSCEVVVGVVDIPMAEVDDVLVQRGPAVVCSPPQEEDVPLWRIQLDPER